jgi:hypothetical protein
MLLGELLGAADPTAAVTEELRLAMSWYQEQIPLRFERGSSPDYVCNHLTEPLGDFMGSARRDFCTNLTSEVAALTLEAILRFAPQFASTVAAQFSSDESESPSEK